MYTKLFSSYLQGLKAAPLEIECSLTPGFPYFHIVGLSQGASCGTRERIRSAFKSSGIPLPNERITLNLRPEQPSSASAALDLGIAVALMAAEGLVPPDAVADTVFVGELALDGHLQPLPAALSYALGARDNGFSRIVLPGLSAVDVQGSDGIEVLGIASLQQLLDYLRGFLSGEELRSACFSENSYADTAADPNADSACFDANTVDLKDIYGQEDAKRALTVAAAGFHNLLLVGMPGIGKTMLAKALPGLLPPMSLEERSTLKQIYSAAGRALPFGGSLGRPFISPHHSIPPTALLGGGADARPGEISLAQSGLLFLDELSEFGRDTLESLRLPLEEHEIRIHRMQTSAVYPADFLLIAGMNPCPCGYYPDRSRCRCSEASVHRYLQKISGPLLDRLDLVLLMEAPEEQAFFSGKPGLSSAEARERIAVALERQRSRFRGRDTKLNARMTPAEIAEFCPLDADAGHFLETAFSELRLSPRSYNKLLCVSRTVADLDDSERIETAHLAEAVHYRGSELFAPGSER